MSQDNKTLSYEEIMAAIEKIKAEKAQGPLGCCGTQMSFRMSGKTSLDNNVIEEYTEYVCYKCHKTKRFHN